MKNMAQRKEAVEEKKISATIKANKNKLPTSNKNNKAI